MIHASTPPFLSRLSQKVLSANNLEILPWDHYSSRRIKKPKVYCPIPMNPESWINLPRSRTYLLINRCLIQEI